MRSSQLASLLTTAIQQRMRVLIKGKPGIGKTELVGDVTSKLGADLVLMHPAISDPTDYKGMPALTKRGTEAHFLPFGDLSRLCAASKPTVCFLDDIGQAAPMVQAALMQLVLGRQVNGTRISDHVVFVGATNDTTHLAGVSGMIEPLKSRWDTIVELEVSVEDWCGWAIEHDMASELVGYIRFKPASLSDFKPTKELRNSPSPRGWASVGRWLAAGVRDMEVYGGAVGEGAAVEFMAYLDVCATLPSLDAIIEAPDKITVPTKPGVLFALASGLARRATADNLAAIIRYLERMPVEFNVTAVRDALRRDRPLTQTAAFVQWAMRHKDVLI